MTDSRRRDGLLRPLDEWDSCTFQIGNQDFLWISEPFRQVLFAKPNEDRKAIVEGRGA